MSQPGGARERQAEILQRQRAGLIRSILFTIALMALGVIMALRPRPLEVVSITPATALDAAFQPVAATDSFGPEDTFFVSVQLRNYRPGMELIARWRYEGEVIRETRLETDSSGDGYAGFVLRNENPPWPVGRYTVEIVYGGESLGMAEFRVEE